MRTKRILFVAASPKYGGTEKHLIDLIGRLDTSDGQVSIVCTGKDVFSGRLTSAQKEQIQVEMSPQVHSFLDWFFLFRAHRPDVVVLVKSWTWCFPWFTHLAARLAGVKHRYTIAHLPPSRIPGASASRIANWRYTASHWRQSLSCTATICVSNFVRRALVEDCCFPAHKTFVIQNGVSLSTYQADQADRSEARLRLNIPDEMVGLICVASLVEQKRVDVLLDALSQVLRSGLKCKCFIVGDGSLLAELQRQAEALELTEHVSFEGFQSDIRAYLQAGDIFVLTSDNEGLPLSILEAMACGLPCVVTDVGGNAEAVLNGQCGVVVSPGSPGEVAHALSSLINRPDHRASMGEAARERVQRHFDIEVSMAQVRQRLLA